MVGQTILMADDDADDRFLVQAAFEDNNIRQSLLFFEDGEQLLDHLSSISSSLKNTRFILLDLNMPKRDGRDVLRVLKTHKDFSTIPIIVFSTSKAPDDINSSYKLGANSYVVKPSSYENLKEVIKKISDFWLNTAITPY